MATENSRTAVSQLYVALFGRAPDAEGLAYWASLIDTGRTVAQIADIMFSTTPARAYFPAGASANQVVASFYLNVLGRTADAEGLAFWTAKLEAPGATAGTLIAEMVDVVANYKGTVPAGVSSAALFNNRAAAAEFYGDHNGSLANATKVLANVTALTSSIAAAGNLVLTQKASGAVDAGGYDSVVVRETSGNLTITNLHADGHVVMTTNPVAGVEWALFTPDPAYFTIAYDFKAPYAQPENVFRLTLQSASDLNVGYISSPGAGKWVVTGVDTDNVQHESRIATKDSSLSVVDLELHGNTNFSFSHFGYSWFRSVDASQLDGSLYYAYGGSIIGTEQGDSLGGLSGNDTIHGGGGNDGIFSGSGADTVYGGLGADEFYIDRNTSRDVYTTIGDFSRTQHDTIGLFQVSLSDVSPLFRPDGIALAAGASFHAYLNAATSGNPAASGKSIISWFTLQGDTWLVIDNSNQASFEDGVDQVIRLSGTFNDLAHASITDWTLS